MIERLKQVITEQAQQIIELKKEEPLTQIDTVLQEFHRQGIVSGITEHFIQWLLADYKLRGTGAVRPETDWSYTLIFPTETFKRFAKQQSHWLPEAVILHNMPEVFSLMRVAAPQGGYIPCGDALSFASI